MRIKRLETFSTRYIAFVRATLEDGSIGWGQLSTYNSDITADVFHRQAAPWVLGEEAWPIDPASTELCGEDWFTVLTTTPTGGPNGVIWYSLAHQWIAAQLNVLNGACPDDVAGELIEAGEDLAANCREFTGANRGRAEQLADTLDAYNNGDIGPGHCSGGDE